MEGWVILISSASWKQRQKTEEAFETGPSGFITSDLIQLSPPHTSVPDRHKYNPDTDATLPPITVYMGLQLEEGSLCVLVRICVCLCVYG